MDAAWIRAHAGCDGTGLEDSGQEAAIDGRGRRSSMIDYYTIAGMAVVGFVVGIVALRLAKDEVQLRRKRLLEETR